MKLKVSELRAVSDQLFSYLEATQRSEFEVAEDLYWSIENEHAYNPLRDPAPEDLTMGQLSNDWNNLRAVLENQAPPVGYGLVWLSSVLRIIGEKSAH